MFKYAKSLIDVVAAAPEIARSLLEGQLNRRKRSMIEEAGDIARQRVRDEAGTLIAASFVDFARRTAIKVAVVLALWTALKLGVLPPAYFPWLVAGLIGALTVFDIYKSWPIITATIAELYDHKFKPIAAMRELVAARVFAEVLEEANAKDEGWVTTAFLALAGTNKDELSLQIAKEVSDIARATTWEDIRPFIFAAAARFVLVLALYNAFLIIIIKA